MIIDDCYAVSVQKLIVIKSVFTVEADCDKVSVQKMIVIKSVFSS